jgi:hypothetical protein
MPLKLNIGLNRKVGEPNYSSRGASVHLEIELDSQLVTEPARLQERIRQCFGMVRASLDEELNGSTSPAVPDPSAPEARPQPPNGNGNGNGNGRGTNHVVSTRPATPSQIRAICAIARRQCIELGAFLLDRFQVASAEDLSIQEASAAIDELKVIDSSNRS